MVTKKTKRRHVFELCASWGLALVLGGIAFGVVGQVTGYTETWIAGITISATGAIAAITGGIGLALHSKKSAPRRTPPSN
jgi:hypothetical protein